MRWISRCATVAACCGAVFRASRARRKIDHARATPRAINLGMADPMRHRPRAAVPVNMRAGP
ncbi:hypothetical protein [Roseivivax sp. CAU 1753]